MSEHPKPLRLGADRTWGETTCGYGLGEPECNQAAVWHLMWIADGGHTSNSCAEHMVFIRERAGERPYEVHAFAGDCSMPGSLWHHPYEDEDEGYCLFPAVDDASLLTEEAPVRELASVAVTRTTNEEASDG